jgi:hypothetical protein
MKKTFRILMAVLFIMSLGFTACKRSFDEPPYITDPNIKVTTTIAQMQAMYPGTALTFTDSLTISGVITGNDQADNLYKKLIIQDSTGAIDIEVDASSLYSTYPVGRRIFVSLKGLTLATYGGLLEIGQGVDPTTGSPLRITGSIFSKYVTLGSTGNVVVPLALTIDQLKPAYQNMLVKLTGVQFDDAELGNTYADSVNQATENRTIKDCNGNSALVRTSNYATFANTKVAQGKGDLIGIYTFYNSEQQMYIRDLTDVSAMTGLRCDGTSATDSTTQLSIDTLRAMYKGADVVIPAKRYIKGIVISDLSKGNITNLNMIIQEGTGKAGMLVRFTSAYTFTVGQEVQINVGSLTMTAYQGELEIDNALVSNAKATGNTGTITPRVVTAAQLAANMPAWGSSLVTLQNVAIGGGTTGTWSGNTTITDATGSIVSNTRTAASFATAAYPTAATSFTGIASKYISSNEVNMRDTTDVVAGSNGNTGTGGTGTGGTGTGGDGGNGGGVGGGDGGNGGDNGGSGNTGGSTPVTATLTEDFSAVAKAGYDNDTLSLTTGDWSFNDALIGTLASKQDIKSAGGSFSARLRGSNTDANTGYLMLISPGIKGVQTVAVDAAGDTFSEKTGSTFSFSLYSSTDGTNWTQVGDNTTLTSGTISTTTFNINATAGTPVMLKILNTSSNSTSYRARIGIGKIVITTSN